MENGSGSFPQDKFEVLCIKVNAMPLECIHSLDGFVDISKSMRMDSTNGTDIYSFKVIAVDATGAHLLCQFDQVIDPNTGMVKVGNDPDILKNKPQNSIFQLLSTPFGDSLNAESGGVANTFAIGNTKRNAAKLKSPTRG